MTEGNGEMRREKVALGLPYYRNFEGQTTLCLMEMIANSTQFLSVLPIRANGAYIESNRNAAVEYALNTGFDFDWFMWVDSDMIFPPDTLLRLIAHEKDIIGCNYRQRTPPYNSVGAYADNDPMDVAFTPGLHRMLHLPTGLLLTRFDIYRKMPRPWFNAALSPAPRDDVYFCNKAREMGYDIWCEHDLTFQVKHIDTQEIPWFDRSQIVTRGSQLSKTTGIEEAMERAQQTRREFDDDLQRILPSAGARPGR